jgi:hypothetical protein
MTKPMSRLLLLLGLVALGLGAFGRPTAAQKDCSGTAIVCSPGPTCNSECYCEGALSCCISACASCCNSSN